ncbi:MAG: DNA (cytosine-5-)-methyltransferase [Planctomycetota bacterium]|nr:DNA (cytosine-5-)-methyltransferase [Planctomycetota bacterium]
MRSLELFTGCGGLALGMSAAGFQHEAVVEFDHDCCETLRLNRGRKIEHVQDWPIVETDVRGFDFDSVTADVVGGGVPCQPFSLGGKHLAERDARDMFPAFAKAVERLRPKAFVVENVKGLLRSTFADYFEYVLLRLSHPAIPLRGTWREHRRDLERIHTSGRTTDLDYNVVFRLVNAADFGVPQRRERVFIVGFRSDIDARWSFPAPTHSRLALYQDQWVTGEYWDRYRVPKAKRPTPPNVKEVPGIEEFTKPWRTVRDAIDGLPRLRPGQTSRLDPNHFLNPGARSYAGHTGSPLDEPAKTLKAGDHGVPGGENTLALPDGSVRYFSVREAARLQTFPDSYWFAGSWTERMRQVGNAVPVELARIMAASIACRLTSSETVNPKH